MRVATEEGRVRRIDSDAPSAGFEHPAVDARQPAARQDQGIGSPELGVEYVRDYAPLFGDSAPMRAIRDIIEKVAGTRATILVRGESGVGKEVVARSIHAAGSHGPFVKVNCAALPSGLLESELFGHERGAFTGAHNRKLGKFELAANGTLFLDEVGELPPFLQAKLLHVLQDLEFSRVGGHQAITVRCRVVAATNRDLEAAMATGEFRDDLYYRLNVVEIRVPPLRDRLDEIPTVASAILSRLNAQYGRSFQLGPEHLDAFSRYDWPGNVREMENVLRRLVVLQSDPSADETLATLRRRARQPAVTHDGHQGARAVESGRGLAEIARRAAREAERQAIAEVLERVHWNRTEAARILQVSYKTLLSKMVECGLGGRTREPAPPGS
jgi:two-component system response regulator AtoC